jgi:hypothetical protein
MNDEKKDIAVTTWCEAGVRFERKGDVGVKRFMNDDELALGIELGLWLFRLYKDGGRLVEVAVRRRDGTFEEKSGADFEAEVGLVNGRLE